MFLPVKTYGRKYRGNVQKVKDKEKERQTDDQQEEMLGVRVLGWCRAAPLVSAMQSSAYWALAQIPCLNVTTALFSSFSFSSWLTCAFSEKLSYPHLSCLKKKGSAQEHQAILLLTRQSVRHSKRGITLRKKQGSTVSHRVLTFFQTRLLRCSSSRRKKKTKHCSKNL